MRRNTTDRPLIQIVRKDNDLVQAKYNFTVWESRLFLFLITQIRRDDTEDTTYRLWYKDIKEVFGLNSNRSYDLLRKAARGLVSKSVVVHWQKSNGVIRERTSRLIRFVDVMSDRNPTINLTESNEEYVDVAIDRDMIPMLLDIRRNFDPNVDRYTSYQLRDVRKLGAYGIRIYELFKQNAYRGECTFSVQYLREMFELLDVYPKFSDFYRRIVQSSVDDINRYTDLTIPAVRKIRRGRKVTELHFTILKKTEEESRLVRGETAASPPPPPPKPETPEARQFRQFEADVVNRFGVTPKKFMKALEENVYSDEQIRDAIQVTNRAKYQQQIRKSVAGFFLRALRDGFTDEKLETERRLRERHARRERLQAEIRELKIQRGKLLNDGIRELVARDASIIAAAMASIRENPMTEAFILEREAELARELQVDDYRKDPRLVGLMTNAIVEQNPEHFGRLTHDMDEIIQERARTLLELG